MNEETRNQVNVKEYGAIGDGKADDTQAVRAALQALAGGGEVIFPAGTYRISGNIPVLHDHTKISGIGRSSVIVYTYEQQESDNTVAASLFTFRDGICDVTVCDLRLDYTGSFFPYFGESYKGKVNGLKFGQCSDVLVEGVEISGFNANAIDVSTGDPARYASRFRVHQCRLHHNRVAGVLFGNVEYISIVDCDLEYNGSEPDGGTGYGCAGSSAEAPRHIQIIGNRASHNYRKGIDLHAGTDALIEGNICHANRLYGIYTEGSKTGNVIIKGNIISGMRRDTIGLPEPYTWIAGIDFGPYSESLVADEYHHYIVEGNLFTDFGIDREGDSYAIRCYYNFRKGIVQIRNNVIHAGRVTHLIVLAARAPGERETKIDISGNRAFIDEVTQYTMQLPHCSQISIQNNDITTNQSNRHDGIISLNNDSLRSLVYIGNQIVDPSLTAPHALGQYGEAWLKNKTVKLGNFLNHSVEPE